MARWNSFYLLVVHFHLKKTYIQTIKKILILGGSGFIGKGLYKELAPFYDVHATYCHGNSKYETKRNFHQWDATTEPLGILLDSLHPDLIISAMRGDFEAQVIAHFEIIGHLMKNNCRLIFLSSANVFDGFTNFPSYEYDKTLSFSIYGRFKIKIENALLRLPNRKYLIARLPMVFGPLSPRVKELKTFYKVDDSIEVFPNVVINATTLSRLTQQLHYLINHEAQGVFHLGSVDLVHHEDLMLDICKTLKLENPRITQVYESNDDRFLAVLPKENPLPKHLEITIQEVIDDAIIRS